MSATKCITCTSEWQLTYLPHLLNSTEKIENAIEQLCQTIKSKKMDDGVYIEIPGNADTTKIGINSQTNIISVPFKVHKESNFDSHTMDEVTLLRYAVLAALIKQLKVFNFNCPDARMTHNSMSRFILV